MSHMSTPLGMLYVVEPSKLEEINRDAVSGEPSKQWEVTDVNYKEMGRILKIMKTNGLLEITIGINRVGINVSS